MPRTGPNEALMGVWGERLKKARVTAGYETAEDLAAEVPVEAPRYRRYERGETLPPLWILARVSELTGRSLDYLLLGKVRPTSLSRPRSPTSVSNEVVTPKVGRKINGAGAPPFEDHSRFIHDLGGPKKVAEFIREKTRRKLTQQGVSQWRRRGIPSLYRILLEELAAQRGVPLPDRFHDPWRESRPG